MKSLHAKSLHSLHMPVYVGILVCHLPGIVFYRFGVTSPNMDNKKMREVSLDVRSDPKACFII